MSVAENYDPIARDFCEMTISVDRSEPRGRFLQYLQQGARILDAGCGSGCDTKEFIRHGFDVVAIDGSKEMVKFAEEYTGQKIHLLTFEEMQFAQEFDAIWASYSLVHYSDKQLKEMLSKFMRTLKVGGYWYLSFRYGEGENPHAELPYFLKTEKKLRGCFSQFPQLEEKDMWVAQGISRSGQMTEFLHCIVKKNEPLLEERRT